MRSPEMKNIDGSRHGATEFLSVAPHKFQDAVLKQDRVCGVLDKGSATIVVGVSHRATRSHRVEGSSHNVLMMRTTSSFEWRESRGVFRATPTGQAIVVPTQPRALRAGRQPL